MRFVTKALSIFGGGVLCVIGIFLSYCLLRLGIPFLGATLLEGNRFYFGPAYQWHLPGRLFYVILLGMVIVCLGGGIWLIRLAFVRDERRQT